MKVFFDTDFYKKLLEEKKKSNDYTLENPIRLKLILYERKVECQICYNRRNKYYTLIFNYIEKKISAPTFQGDFIQLEKDHGQEAKMIVDDIERLGKFPIYLDSEKNQNQYKFIFDRIFDLCILAADFGPDDGISDEDFHSKITENFSKIQTLLKE